MASLVAHAHAGFETVYQVSRLKPATEVVGNLHLTRTASRSGLAFLGPYSSMSCIFSADYTVVSTGRAPADNAMLYEPKATGRLAFIPLLPSTLLLWDPIQKNKNPRGAAEYKVVNVQVVQGGGKHYWQPADVTYDAKGRVTEVSTKHNGTTECLWTYSDYQNVEGFSVPGVISQSRYKASGLNISTDESVEWRLTATREVPDDSLIDARLLANGARIIDYRQQSLGSSATYSRASGNITDQLQSPVARGTRPQSGGIGKLFVWLSVAFGIAIGIVGARRSFALQGRN